MEHYSVEFWNNRFTWELSRPETANFDNWLQCEVEKWRNWEELAVRYDNNYTLAALDAGTRMAYSICAHTCNQVSAEEVNRRLVQYTRFKFFPGIGITLTGYSVDLFTKADFLIRKIY